MIRIKKINAHEKGLYFQNGAFEKKLEKGWHFFFKPFVSCRVDVVSERTPWLYHKDLDMIIQSGLLKKELTVIDLTDQERALVWIDKRFASVLKPGRYALWNTFCETKVEIISADSVRFNHKELEAILHSSGSEEVFCQSQVEQGFVGLLFINGEYKETLKPGKYAFWKNRGKVSVIHKDLRIQSLDVCGQEILTKDNVTLRINAYINFRITDPYKAVMQIEDPSQALYREAQLGLRALIGFRELSSLLEDKNSVIRELKEMLSNKCQEYGLEIFSSGIRDIILPGDMKELLNKVIEAKKIAEANLVSRREEVAAIRNQLNTAKMLENNPVLMKLKEFEVLEKVAQSSKLQILLGEKGLAEKVLQLI